MNRHELERIDAYEKAHEVVSLRVPFWRTPHEVRQSRESERVGAVYGFYAKSVYKCPAYRPTALTYTMEYVSSRKHCLAVC